MLHLVVQPVVEQTTCVFMRLLQKAFYTRFDLTPVDTKGSDARREFNAALKGLSGLSCFFFFFFLSFFYHMKWELRSERDGWHIDRKNREPEKQKDLLELGVAKRAEKRRVDWTCRVPSLIFREVSNSISLRIFSPSHSDLLHWRSC